MSSQQDAPALVQLGAGSDDSTRGVNLDVSGTVGPDYLGQEAVDVDGDPNDRPGVRSRLPENCPDHSEIRRMDTGEELPVLLSSSMRADPCEGVQGSYTKIVEGECARCGYDRLKVSVVTLAGEAQETCNACGAKQRPRSGSGYSMPPTDKDRVKQEKDAGRRLTGLTSRAVYDLEPDTGCGAYISLVGDRSYTRLPKADVADLFWALVENDDLDLAEQVRSREPTYVAASLGVKLLPDGMGVHVSDADDNDE